MRALGRLVNITGIPEELPVQQINDGFVYVDTLENYTKKVDYTEDVEQVLMQPFRFDYYGIFVCRGGSLSYMSDLKTCSMTANSCIVLSPDSIGEITSYTKDLKVIGIALDPQHYPTPTPRIANVMFKLSDTELEILVHNIRLICEMCKLGTVAASSINLQIAAMYDLLAGFYSAIPQVKQTKPLSLVKEFLSLVATKAKEERRLTYYAARLGISPKYLSTVTKQHTGMSAADWIRERLIQEAKILLLSENYQIWQVSDILGFPNESFFGTYFKKATGMTPAKFSGSR